MKDRVRIVAVSHSERLADGVVELAGQMAPDVDLVAAGGGDDGALGTSFDRIMAALSDPPDAGVVVLYDLGSALLTTETALEFLDAGEAARVEVVDAPLVEGALAAATTAQGGADRAAVAAAARAAGGGPAGPPATAELGPAVVERTVTLRNPLGLHARPAAQLGAALVRFDATVQLGRPDGPAVAATSVLDVVDLALRGGEAVRIGANGPAAHDALAAAVALIESGFGEAGAAGAAAGASDDAAGAAGGAGGEPAPAAPTSPDAEGPLPGAPGRASGPLVRAGEIRLEVLPGAGVDAERDRLAGAVDAARERLTDGDEFARMHAALLLDPTLRTTAERAIDAGVDAASAWWAAVLGSADSLADSANEMVAARAIDVRDAGTVVLAELGTPSPRIPADVAGAVLTTDEIGPGELVRFLDGGGVAVVLSAGSNTAHAVIVAKQRDLPLVLRAGQALDDVADGTTVTVDGTAGTIEVG